MYYYWGNSFIWGGFYGIYVVAMLAALPYAVSFCEEYNTNMLRVLLMKAGKHKYCMSKVLTTFLDEPMNGLDNHGVEEIRKFLLGVKEEGKLIFIISHNREDINLLYDRVYERDMGVLTQ